MATVRQSPGARRLKAFRRRQGWTLAQAAGRYGVSESAWSRWEAGLRRVPVPLLRWIKRAQ